MKALRSVWLLKRVHQNLIFESTFLNLEIVYQFKNRINRLLICICTHTHIFQNIIVTLQSQLSIYFTPQPQSTYIHQYCLANKVLITCCKQCSTAMICLLCSLLYWAISTHSLIPSRYIRCPLLFYLRHQFCF